MYSNLSIKKLTGTTAHQASTMPAPARHADQSPILAVSVLQRKPGYFLNCQMPATGLLDGLNSPHVQASVGKIAAAMVIQRAYRAHRKPAAPALGVERTAASNAGPPAPVGLSGIVHSSFWAATRLVAGMVVLAAFGGVGALLAAVCFGSAYAVAGAGVAVGLALVSMLRNLAVSRPSRLRARWNSSGPLHASIQIS